MISRWLSVATPPVLMLSSLIDPSGIALCLPTANDIVEMIPKLRMSLESLQDSKTVDVIDSGGVAWLSHRLITVMPSAKGDMVVFPTPLLCKKILHGVARWG